MAMGPPPHARCCFPVTLIKCGSDRRELRLPVQLGSSPRNDHSGIPPYAFRRRQPRSPRPALQSPWPAQRSPRLALQSPQAALQCPQAATPPAARAPPPPGRLRPGLYLQPCALRTPVPPAAPTARAMPPPRTPRILVKPDRLPILARAHGVILKICYKIVNKLRKHGHGVSLERPPPPPPATLMSDPRHAVTSI
jgi:hypothetical protein